MQQQRLSLPALDVGETWTIQIRDDFTGELDITVFVKTAGGSIVSVPMRRGGDIGLTAGSDVGETLLTISLDGAAGDRTVN